MTSRAKSKAAPKPVEMAAPPTRVEPVLLLQVRLAAEKVRRLTAEQRAIAAELLHARGQSQQIQTTLARTYGLQQGDEIAEDGAIVRSNGQAGPAFSPPDKQQETKPQ